MADFADSIPNPKFEGRLPSTPMNPAPSVSIREALGQSPVRTNPARLLYAAFALLLVVVTFLGFQRFYLHGRAYPDRVIPAPMLPLIVTHGAAMTGWIVLFLVQPLLIVGNHRRLHMTLGKIGGGLAAIIVGVGLIVPIEVVRHGPEFTLWGLTRRQFMAIPIFSVLLFGLFVTIGIWNRRRPQIHRPMMLLATLSIIAAATDRITGLSELYSESLWGRVFGPYFPALLVGALFLVVKWLLTWSFDRWYSVGFAALVAAWAAIMVVATSAPWARIASFLAG